MTEEEKRCMNQFANEYNKNYLKNNPEKAKLFDRNRTIQKYNKLIRELPEYVKAYEEKRGWR